MQLLLLGLAVLALVLGPGVWVRQVVARHQSPPDRYAFTGAHLARRLLDGAGLQQVRVETSPAGDHYDPAARAVRLSEAHADGCSLAAVTVAAHEVGHALQHDDAYAPLMLRTALVEWVAPLERIGVGLIVLAPVLLAITRVPAGGLITATGGLLVLGGSTAVHLLTLPTELDASFSRALPMLIRNNILHVEDRGAARTLLLAAALTYVAASLSSLLNVARWWAIIRR